jgi:thiol-disulfide isomerase/thioredoxin
MQNPNEDTEWNDVLRAKGIIPPKEVEIKESDIVNMIEDTIENLHNGKKLDQLDLDELDELEDSEDERVLEDYRKKRIAELQQLASKAKFGCVREISGVDYVDEVTKAGEGIYVVLHLYARGVPFCSLINQFIEALAPKYPQIKFLRSIATTCIPNFPEKNCPTIFIYHEGKIVKQFIGATELRGPNLSLEELDYMLGKAGLWKVGDDPRQTIKDELFSRLADSNDW